MKKYLELAVSSMENLENVRYVLFLLVEVIIMIQKSSRWAVQAHDPLWTEAAIIKGLTRLPHLEDLQLTLNRTNLPQLHDHRLTSSRHAQFDHSLGQIQLDHLSGLKKISLSGNHVHYPRDMISRLAGLIAKSPQLVHLEVK